MRTHIQRADKYTCSDARYDNETLGGRQVERLEREANASLQLHTDFPSNVCLTAVIFVSQFDVAALCLTSDTAGVSDGAWLKLQALL